MRTIISMLLLTSMLCTSSCTYIGTLYSISDDSQVLIPKSDLVGKWWDAEDSSFYLIIDSLSYFDGADYKIYGIEVNREEKVEDTLFFLGNLTKIDSWYFFEYWYDLKKEIGNFAVPRRLVMRLAFPGNDKIEITNFNTDELLKLIDQKKIHLNYAKQEINSKYRDYNYLIIDKTPALRKALMETKKYPKVYEEKITLTRLQGRLF